MLDGVIWKIVILVKKDLVFFSCVVDEIVFLFGVDDVVVLKIFYVECGILVGKSFGCSYV